MSKLKMLLAGIASWGVMSFPTYACTSTEAPNRSEVTNTSSNTTTYIYRGNNRCEGQRLRNSVSGALELISLSVTQTNQLGDTLPIRVPGGSAPSAVSIRSQPHGYWLDNLSMNHSRGYGYSFNLPTNILISLNINVEDLRGVARTERGSIRYRPVIFGQGSTGKYSFVFYSARRVQFLETEILDNQGNVIAAWGEQAPRLGGEKAFAWTSSANHPAGEYTLRYVAEISQRNRRPERIVRRIRFAHNPAWLSN